MIGLYTKLGELLIERGSITNLQLQVALAAQQTCRRRLGEILVERGFVTEFEIAEALADQYGYAFVDAATLEPMSEALQCISPEMAMRHMVLPVSATEGVMFCAICDPLDVYGTDVATMLSGHRIKLAVATESSLREAIAKAYGLSVEPEATPIETPLPERFENVKRRRQIGTSVQYDAVDSVLSRAVTLIGDMETAEVLRRAKKLASVSSDWIAEVYDFFEFNGFGWVVMPRLEGENLGLMIRTRGPRSAVESAQIVARMAEVSDQLLRATSGCGLIHASNILVTANGPLLAPFWGAPSVEGDEMVEVAALGSLLRECLTGLSSGSQAAALLEALPQKLRETMERCDPSNPDRFAAAVQVAQALASCTWQVSTQAGSSAAYDRDALLEQSTNVIQPSRSFWSRLFGRREAA
ncbi:MAG: hypothetical protein HZC36_15835 [Armatimonadetes bacterium]|nr:hypothetical protein [Armatimonadota bacterium]